MPAGYCILSWLGYYDQPWWCNVNKPRWSTAIVTDQVLYVVRDDCGDMHLPAGCGPSQTGLPGDRISSLHWNHQCLSNHLP